VGGTGCWIFEVKIILGPYAAPHLNRTQGIERPELTRYSKIADDITGNKYIIKFVLLLLIRWPPPGFQSFQIYVLHLSPNIFIVVTCFLNLIF